MSEQKTEHSLDVVDIINATKIMEAAIQANAFSVEDLVKVAPVVERFIKFSNAVIAEHNASVEVEAEEAKESKDEGSDNE